MRNQFFYTEEVEMPGTAENTEKGILASDPYIKEKICSFNVDSVIRSLEMDDDRILVLLNDLHEREEDVKKMNKNGKLSIVRQKGTFQSEIYLSKDDGKRFYKLTNIENHE